MISAVVGSFDNVGAKLGENSGDAMQSSGIIGKVNAQTDKAPIFYEATLDDAGEQRDIDVSAANEDCNFFPLEGKFVIQQRGDRGRPRAFGESFFALEEQQDCIGDFFLLNGDNVVHIF